MTRRRILLALGLSLLLLGGAFALLAIGWQAFKRDQGIERLDWHGLRLSPAQLALDRLELQRRDAEGAVQQLRLDGVRLHLAGLRPQTLEIARLSFDARSAGGEAAADGTALPEFSDELLHRLAGWLPRALRVAEFQLTLPCAAGICREQGAFELQRAETALLPVSATLQLRPGDTETAHQLTLQLDARPAQAATELDLALSLDGTPRLSLHSRLQDAAGQLGWDGGAALNGLPEASWLLPWLCRWTPCDARSSDPLPTDMRLGAAWALTLPVPRPLAGLPDWRQAAGELRLSAELPGHWPVPALGELRGRLELAARGEAGAWLPERLDADLELVPADRLLQPLPAALRPEALQLRLTPRATEDGSLGLQLQAHSRGGPELALEGGLRVRASAAPELIIDSLRGRLRSARLEQAGLQLRQLDLRVRLDGRLDRAGGQLRFGEARLEAARLRAAGATANGLDARCDGLVLDLATSPEAAYHARGPLQLRVQRLEQPALRPLEWNWQARLEAKPQRLDVQGTLRNGAGLALALQAGQTSDGLRAELTLAELFLRAGNPLAATLADWPNTLELASGRLKGDARLRLPTRGALQLDATLNGRGLAGLYDTAEFDGLAAEVRAGLRGERLQVQINDLQLARLNPGLSIGPLQLRGRYDGQLATLGSGRLAWSQAETQLLGGRLWLAPGSLELGRAAQPLDLQLQGLEIDALLRAYPAEGLAGSGTLDGRLDARYGPAGLGIAQGRLAARAPGGVLRFNSPRLEALAAANPTMKLVTEALHDFHYSLLTSDVRYDESGKLQLGLRIEGRNPALEGGRPVNFSINLEEDIPALLTSLQLSDRVSETIQRRVQQRLQR